jgi:uncharacterized repeat protein (TIGR03803 family)
MNRRSGYATAAALTVAVGASAAAAQETVLHRFRGGSDGASPVAGLAMEGHVFFGTTLAGGGPRNDGALFALSPPAAGQTRWVETVLHRFRGGHDGSMPEAGLFFDARGILYGTTVNGGATAKNPVADGTVFDFASGQTPPLKLLYRFLDGFDAATPAAGLIMDPHGILYGTTQGGGGSGNGTVFSLTPPAPRKKRWTEQVLYRFAGPPNDGAMPVSGLLIDGGELFGTTSVGGASSNGTVFRLRPATGGTGWTEEVLYAFKGGSDGAFPTAGLIIDAAGALYGTTSQGGSNACQGAGCGTVFKLSPGASGYTETVLHRFTGGSDGIGPAAGLFADAKGNLFGTTIAGGTGCFAAGCGTVFKLSPPAAGGNLWTENVVYRFRGGRDGERPAAGLVADKNGVLYGTTERGGTGCDDAGCGIVFKFVP